MVLHGNQLFNTAPRETGNPVVPIDVVGGQRWRVVANDIRDFAKAGGDRISYAAFFKGNGRDGRFERNLVVCEDTHSGGVRLGLSRGGGSAPDSICEGGDCSTEHTGGVLENNIIRDCPADVGIYLNAAADTQLRANLLVNTTGIDVRFAASTARLEGNVSDGPVRERDGGVATETDNRLSLTTVADIYADPGTGDFRVAEEGPLLTRLTTLPALDFCGAPGPTRPSSAPWGEL